MGKLSRVKGYARLLVFTLVVFWSLRVFATSDKRDVTSDEVTSLQTSSNEVTFDKRDVELFRVVQRKFGFAFIQVVNYDYLPLVLNWVCGVPSGVLEKTVFVTSDERTATALSSAGLQRCLVPFRTGAMKYGDKAYFRYMMYRTLIVEKLLQENVTVWIVESDATWFEDPSLELERFQEYDILAGSNGIIKGVHQLQAGFIFLNATDRTRTLWSTLRKEQARQITSRSSDITDAGNEMNILQTLLTHVRFDHFDAVRFVSGQWYEQCKTMNFKVPAVIQNNFIIGNKAKVRRMQKWGHWFLTEDFSACPATLRENLEYFVTLAKRHDASLFPQANQCL